MEENKIEGNPKESRKGAIWFSMCVIFLGGFLMFATAQIAKGFGAENPIQYSICAGILLIIMLCSILRFNQK